MEATSFGSVSDPISAGSRKVSAMQIVLLPVSDTPREKVGLATFPVFLFSDATALPRLHSRRCTSSDQRDAKGHFLFRVTSKTTIVKPSFDWDFFR